MKKAPNHCKRSGKRVKRTTKNCEILLYCNEIKTSRAIQKNIPLTAIEHATHIAVIGAGIVGAATGKGLASLGHKVTFCDIDESKLAALRAEGHDACHTKELAGRDIDVALINIATPTVDGHFKTDYLMAGVKDVAEAVLATATKRVTVAVRSTVLPGTTENLVVPELERVSGKRAGRDFGVCMNPEFLRAESPEKDFMHPKGIIIGAIDESSAAALSAIYEPLEARIHVCTPSEAELAKYCCNIFDACKIAFFNEMRTVGDAAGIDADSVFPLVRELCEACWNPGYGLRDMGPFDGMCFPKDTNAFLTWGKEDLKLPMHILGAMLTENKEMETYFPWRHKIAKALIRLKSGWKNSFGLRA